MSECWKKNVVLGSARQDDVMGYLIALTHTDEGRGDPKLTELIHWLKELGQTTDAVTKFQRAAYDLWNKDGEVEVDTDAAVSFSSDGGAYVGAWVWVYNEEAGVEDGGA